VDEILNVIGTITGHDAVKCSRFFSFLRENRRHLNIHIVKPSTRNSPEIGNWPPEGLLEEPVLFSVGSTVVEDFVGRGRCNECEASKSTRCEPEILFNHGAAIGGIYGIASLNDGAHLSSESDPSTIGILKYVSSKTAQLDTPTEDGKVHQVSI